MQLVSASYVPKLKLPRPRPRRVQQTPEEQTADRDLGAPSPATVPIIPDRSGDTGEEILGEEHWEKTDPATEGLFLLAAAFFFPALPGEYETLSVNYWNFDEIKLITAEIPWKQENNQTRQTLFFFWTKLRSL